MQQQQHGNYYAQQPYPSQGWFNQSSNNRGGSNAWTPLPVPPPTYQQRSSVRYA